MSSKPSNRAAWLDGFKQPLRVAEAPYTEPGPGEIVVKAAHAAVNPVDWKIAKGVPYLDKFPAILGEDIAGEVYAVGPDVQEFKAGDRVILHSLGLGKKDPAWGGFQRYVVGSAAAASKLPSSIPTEEGAVLPLAISTAAAGLYQKGYLELPHPSTDAKPNGQTLLVWGGSSSVGVVAIQLAKASGFKVATTTSARNNDLVKNAGADLVFDYNESSAADIAKALKDEDLVGAYDAISENGTMEKVAEILDTVKSPSNKKFIATTLPPPKDGLPNGIKAQGVFAISIFSEPNKSVGDAVWGDFVPAALEKGVLKPLPPPQVVGKDLESTQEAWDLQAKGVSGKKIVVATI